MEQSISSKIKLYDLYPKIYQFFENIFFEKEKIALGISGGSDSMFLAQILFEFWEHKQRDFNNLFFFHCNHKIRKESDDEARFLRNYFKNLNFVYFERETSGEETEQALRERRYSNFDSFCKEHQITTVCLGHNLSDRIETSFMNIIRGCGIKGFLNMHMCDTQPLLPGIRIVRPLLYISKEEIEGRCQTFSIPYFNDRTNFDINVSLRNKIRHNFILPISRISSKAEPDTNNFFESWKIIYRELELNKDDSYRLSAIKINPYRNATGAYEWKIPKNLLSESALFRVCNILGIITKKNEIKNIFNRLSSLKDGFYELQGWIVFFSHQHIYFIKSSSRFWEKKIILKKTITFPGIQVFGNYQLDIHNELVGATLRFPKEGDHFEGKLLTKRAINKKIPIFLRNILPLAEKDEKIIFVFKPQHLIF